MIHPLPCPSPPPLHLSPSMAVVPEFGNPQVMSSLLLAPAANYSSTTLVPTPSHPTLSQIQGYVSLP